MNYLKSLAIIGMVTMIYGIGSVQASFEHQFFCTIDGNTITVSIASGADYCFSYVADIHQSLQNVRDDIMQADEHIREGEEVKYRNNVKIDLEFNQSKLLDLQEKLVAAIDDYEADLFRRVKTILLVSLRDEMRTIQKSATQNENFLNQVKKMGDIYKYQELLEQQTRYYYQIDLIGRMRDARNFLELLEPLKTYIRLVNSANSST